MNTFQYTGRENDGTGLLYYRARYYNPALQRFISEDPLRIVGGNGNLYTYVLNNPTNFIDPFGLVECTKEKKRFFDWLCNEMKKMAEKLDVPVEFLLILAAKEGGWQPGDLDHNIPLNNPFGVQHIENRVSKGNESYDSLANAIQDWIRMYGEGVRGIKDRTKFRDAVQAMYKSEDPNWKTNFDLINMKKWAEACGCDISSSQPQTQSQSQGNN